MEKLLFERSMFFILCEFWLKVKDSSEVRRKNFFGHCRLFNSPYLTLYICFMQCHLADPPLMKWKNFFHPFVFEPPSWLLWKEGDRYNIILVVDPDIKRPCSFYLHSFALFSPLNFFSSVWDRVWCAGITGMHRHTGSPSFFWNSALGHVIKSV